MRTTVVENRAQQRDSDWHNSFRNGVRQQRQLGRVVPNWILAVLLSGELVCWWTIGGSGALEVGKCAWREFTDRVARV